MAIQQAARMRRHLEKILRQSGMRLALMVIRRTQSVTTHMLKVTSQKQVVQAAMQKVKAQQQATTMHMQREKAQLQAVFVATQREMEAHQAVRIHTRKAHKLLQVAIVRMPVALFQQQAERMLSLMVKA